MTPTQARAAYRRARDGIGEMVALRRYSGSGQARTPTDYAMKAVRVRRDQNADELVAGLVQRDRRFIVMLEDVEAAGFPLPINITADRMVVRSQEVTIKDVDGDTRRIAGELIAYEITAGG